jgi:hypothetical protein
MTTKTAIPIETLALYTDADRRALYHAASLLRLLGQRISALQEETEQWMAEMLPREFMHGAETKEFFETLRTAADAAEDIGQTVSGIEAASCAEEVHWHRVGDNPTSKR